MLCCPSVDARQEDRYCRDCLIQLGGYYYLPFPG